MKLTYTAPDVEVIEFEVEDIMMTSGIPTGISYNADLTGWDLISDSKPGWGSVEDF